MSKEHDWIIGSKKFRNKKTGEIVTQVPLLDINDYEEIKEPVKKHRLGKMI